MNKEKRTANLWMQSIDSSPARSDRRGFRERRSEVPDDATAGEKIVLVALARVHIQLRHARPKLSTFTAQSEVLVSLDIES